MDIRDKIRVGYYNLTTSYATEREEYQKQEIKLYDEFVKDLYEHLEIQDHPKKEILFNKAWGLGHAYGYAEILTYAEDLVELIK